ncbi:hypothetical protein Trydic_g16260 [Trypoxylus dichotomus]
MQKSLIKLASCSKHGNDVTATSLSISNRVYNRELGKAQRLCLDDNCSENFRRLYLLTYILATLLRGHYVAN